MNVELLRLPPEVVLLILERLLRIDPIALLGAVPGVCTQLRALCPMVRGAFDLRAEWARLDYRDEYGDGERDGDRGGGDGGREPGGREPVHRERDLNPLGRFRARRKCINV